MSKRVFIGVLAVGCLSGCVQRDVVLEETAARLLALPAESSPFVRILKAHVDRPDVTIFGSGFSIGDGLYVTAQHDMGDLSGWTILVEGYVASVVCRSDLTPDWDDWMVLKVEGLDRPSVKLDADWKRRPNEPFKLFGFDYSESKSFETLGDILAVPLVVVDCYVVPVIFDEASKKKLVVAKAKHAGPLTGYSGAAALGRNGVFAIHHGRLEGEAPFEGLSLERTIQGEPGTLVWDAAE